MMTSPSEFMIEHFKDVSREVTPLEFKNLEDVADKQQFVDCGEQEQAKEILPEDIDGNFRFDEESQKQLIERTKQEAREEICHALTQEMEEKVASVRAMVANACEQFQKEWARYFAEVEEEIVRLALAISAHILHREVMLDPLLLQGAVRVALEKLKENSGITLRVPGEQVDEWKAVLEEGATKELRVLADIRMQPGECVLETSVGRVDLGIKTQLAEIERGFFDLLQKRPM